MLKPALLVLALSSVAPAFAQETPTAVLQTAIHRGAVALSSGLAFGDISYGRSYLYTPTLSYRVQLSPGIGYFVSDHWMLSANVYGGAQQEHVAAEGTVFRHNAQQLGAGAGARYYVGRGLDSKSRPKQLRWFGEAGIAYRHSWERFEEHGSMRIVRYQLDDLVFSGGLGLNYFLSGSVALEGGLSYSRALEDNGRLQFQLGVQCFLHRR